ncbi:hypothetical protein ABVK25_010815 [Lepraria finkii]|uniref:Uncharacterized protein n=1 Tax=Lepraria finkii TaxID=1340010 RepID=A0ABR4AVN6_9LECA
MDAEQENQYSESFVEKQSNFRGSAKIHLRHLNYDSDTSFLDPKNVARLVQIFELEGCLRLDLEHHIPAVIGNDVLQHSLNASGVNRNDLFTPGIPPTLDFPAQVALTCLHGKHLIAAAQEFVEPLDKWWTVDLYSDGLSLPLQRDLREDYANSRNFCDGDIYRQIRYCQSNQDAIGEGRWFARLSEGKRNDVKRLLNRNNLKSLKEALDKLLPYIGFWPAMRIGIFHRILGLKCQEEVVHYLNHIRLFWNTIIEENQNLRPLLDFRSIQLLQTRNPWASTVDNEFIVDLMHRQILFPMITDEFRRARILNRLQESECMVPSLHTWFEDTKWLEPCAKILRDLLPPGCRRSTRRALTGCYSHSGQDNGIVRIQSNIGLINREGSQQEAVESGYRQLWLFAWRHFPDLSSMLPLKDVGKPKPRAISSNDRCWQKLAELARSLGFQSDQIDYLNQNSDHRMAIEFLQQARPKEFYYFPDQLLTHQALAICRLLSSIDRPARNIPVDVPITAHPRLPVELRRGRPHEYSFKDSKPRFFLPDIYATKSRVLSHFSVNQDIFQAFFGHRSPLEALDGTPAVGPQSPPIRPAGSSSQPAPPTQEQRQPPPSDRPEPSSFEPTGSDSGAAPPIEPPNRQPPSNAPQSPRIESAGSSSQPAPPTQEQRQPPPSDRPEPSSFEPTGSDSGAAPPIEPPNRQPPLNAPQSPRIEPAGSSSQPVPPTEPQHQQPPSSGPQSHPVETPAINPQPTGPAEPPPQEERPDSVWYKIRRPTMIQQTLPIPARGINVSLDLFDLEQSTLYNEWRTRCERGDIFVVDASDSRWLHWRSGGSSIRGIPEPLLAIADEYYFAIYYGQRIRCIRIERVLQARRRLNCDGVIYIFRHSKDDFFDEQRREEIRNQSFTHITGETTKTRLYQVEQRICTKRAGETLEGRSARRRHIRANTFTFEETL